MPVLKQRADENGVLDKYAGRRGKAVMKRIFICSPFRGIDMEHNILVAKELCRMAMERGFAPFAPHLLYPQDNPSGREAGIRAGLAFMETCQELWCFIDKGISEDMALYLAHMRKLQINGHKIRLRNFDQLSSNFAVEAAKLRNHKIVHGLEAQTCQI